MVMGAVRGQCFTGMAAPLDQLSFYSEPGFLAAADAGANALACQELV